MIAGAVALGLASFNSQTVKILKAKTAISEGQVLSDDLFDTTEVLTQESWMIGKGEKIEGMIAKHDIAADEYLSKHSLSVKKRVTFLPHEREFTVQTDLSRCVGGDLVEGDVADVLYFDKSSFQAQPLFTVSILGVDNRSGQTLHDEGKEMRDQVPAAVKIKVTAEQAAALLAYEQRGLLAFAKVPEQVVREGAK